MFEKYFIHKCVHIKLSKYFSECRKSIKPFAWIYERMYIVIFTYETCAQTIVKSNRERRTCEAYVPCVSSYEMRAERPLPRTVNAKRNARRKRLPQHPLRTHTQKTHTHTLMTHTYSRMTASCTRRRRYIYSCTIPLLTSDNCLF